MTFGANSPLCTTRGSDFLEPVFMNDNILYRLLKELTRNAPGASVHSWFIDWRDALADLWRAGFIEGMVFPGLDSCPYSAAMDQLEYRCGTPTDG